jgi:Mg-chelatase subunit ChlD
VISPEDRWRLILGSEREQLGQGIPSGAGAALDQLYGEGRGEGANSRVGGSSPSALSVRQWSAELEELFGASVRDQVLARAVARGRSDALLELKPDAVVPSVELLQQLLSLKGALAEDRLARLRALVDRVVRQLVAQLATRMRPALHGSVIARPTRRKQGAPLDLRRTVARNLRTVRFNADGTPQLMPDRLVFKTRARRSLDWRVILVVDVSGSMEASVIYSALMAAILSGLPAVTVHFVAFSTRVIDLSDKVTDPLALLTEIVVGGGTDIARALRYARRLISVPRRTLLVLVTDFEEGGPLPALVAEVRAIAESSARPLGLAALDDRGAPRYTRAIAEEVVAAGMPIAALTPVELAAWIGAQVR